MGEAAVRSLLEPLISQAGYQFAPLEVCEASPAGEVLEVRAVSFHEGGTPKGLDICLSLRPARHARTRGSDPEALSEVLWTFPSSTPLAKTSLRRETLRMAAALLAKRSGRPVDPGPLPEGPDLPLPSVQSGLGPDFGGASGGQRGGVSGGIVGGVVGGRGRVVEFDFRQLKVRYQPPPPIYPPLARAALVEGTVVIDLIIDPDGVPQQAAAIDGPPLLRKVGEDYALQWRFEPALLDGTPQWAKFRLYMPFKLTKPPKKAEGGPAQP